MSLKSIYQRFLEAPNPISLSDNATLHYITTLTSFSGPAAIIRHLETQNKKVVQTKSAKVISAIEGHRSLALEVETVLEFISGGGAYLPGLENFIVDKIAIIPTTHMVYFDAEGKISHVRLTWDQGSLLKQTEVIGSRGRNWPVFDGKDQVRLISSGLPEDPASPRGRSVNPSIDSSRSTSPSKKYIKDPHASLDLFSPRAVDENTPISGPNAVAPRASAKPAPREMSELFAAGHEDHEPGSPKKAPVNVPVTAPKGRSQQKFAPSRLFGDDPDEPAAVPYKSNPAKYNHFDIGEVTEYDPMQHYDSPPKPKAAVPFRGKSAKHGPQWEFQDFYTPAKVGQKVRDHDVVHFSLENPGNNTETPGPRGAKPRRDNETHFELRDDGTPIERHPVHKPRKDAETHFQFKDTDTPAPNRSGRPTSSASDRMGLYTNNLYDEDENSRPQEKAPLATITNNKGRKNDFDSHWTMTDNPDEAPEPAKANIRHSHLKKGLESHWQMGDDESANANTNGKNDKKSFWDF